MKPSIDSTPLVEPKYDYRTWLSPLLECYIFPAWAFISGGSLIILVAQESLLKEALARFHRDESTSKKAGPYLKYLVVAAGVATSCFNCLALYSILKARKAPCLEAKASELGNEQLRDMYLPALDTKSRKYHLANYCGNGIVIFVFLRYALMSDFRGPLLMVFFMLSIPLHTIVIESVDVFIFVGYCMLFEVQRFKQELATPDWATIPTKFKKMEREFRSLCDCINYLVWALLAFACFWFIGFLALGLLAAAHAQITSICVMAVVPVIAIGGMLANIAQHTSMFRSGEVPATYRDAEGKKKEKDVSIKRRVLDLLDQVPQDKLHVYTNFLRYLDMSDSGVHLSPFGVFTTKEVVTVFLKLGSATFLVYSYIVHQVLTSANCTHAS